MGASNFSLLHFNEIPPRIQEMFKSDLGVLQMFIQTEQIDVHSEYYKQASTKYLPRISVKLNELNRVTVLKTVIGEKSGREEASNDLDKEMEDIVDEIRVLIDDLIDFARLTKQVHDLQQAQDR